MSKIAFIGAGNMAKAIIGGLLAENVSARDITASGPRLETLNKVAAQFGIAVSTHNAQTAAAADVVILAVKPQMMKEVSLGLAGSLSHKPLIISLAAGITTTSIAGWLGSDQAIVRCMPNTPSQLREGASGLYANGNVTPAQKALADRMLAAVGIVEWLSDETLINAVTAVSGSGPAYFFLVMEAMIDAGVAQGLTRDCARALTLQTAFGAAILAKQSDIDVAELRQRVTSPNGTTEQAIKSFENDEIRAMFSRAMQACANRAVELSEVLGK
ncbi:MAG: pyrroline-5-carboxylate reductase [Pseudomonadota bacterium]